ncbi:MAG: hypothetical protein B7Z61_06135 [Acidobacteria bacterium 37-71-11]|nr:MAG: hypothetical protein B7Z61_06135 [Acidobacteria bacterium 37-71-11]
MGTQARDPFVRRAVRRAAALLARRVPLGRLLTAAAAALRRPGRPLGVLAGDAAALVRMVRATVAGRYHRLPRRTLVAAVAGLLYLVNPFDLIPDFVPVIGLADDVAVLAWVIRRVRKDLDEYLAWEAAEGGVIDVVPTPVPAP